MEFATQYDLNLLKCVLHIKTLQGLIISGTKTVKVSAKSNKNKANINLCIVTVCSFSFMRPQ